MEKVHRLEFEYAKRLREASSCERALLYKEGYSIVSKMVMENMSDAPECRTAGTSIGYLQRVISFLNPSDNVLELGCGRGYTCLMLASNVKWITGMDVSVPALDEAKSILYENSIKNATLMRLAEDGMFANQLKPNFFDKAISIDVIEHLHPEDARLHLKQVYQVLKPGGAYIIKTPNRIDGPHDITRIIYPNEKKALGFHLNEMSHLELKNELSKVGFKKFRSFFFKEKLPLIMNRYEFPIEINLIMEKIHVTCLKVPMMQTMTRPFLAINLIAYK